MLKLIFFDITLEIPVADPVAGYGARETWNLWSRLEWTSFFMTYFYRAGGGVWPLAFAPPPYPLLNSILLSRSCPEQFCIQKLGYMADSRRRGPTGLFRCWNFDKLVISCPSPRIPPTYHSSAFATDCCGQEGKDWNKRRFNQAFVIQEHVKFLLPLVAIDSILESANADVTCDRSLRSGNMFKFVPITTLIFILAQHRNAPKTIYFRLPS